MNINSSPARKLKSSRFKAKEVSLVNRRRRLYLEQELSKVNFREMLFKQAGKRPKTIPKSQRIQVT